jgi:hypothetical protein
MSKKYQNTVNALLALIDNLKIPEHFLKMSPIRTRNEFDVNDYFSVLDRLSMEPGYVLDYVYSFLAIQGNPIIYARKVDEPPYPSSREYLAERGKDLFLRSKTTRNVLWDKGEAYDRFLEYLNHIQIDDTSQGFFQFIVFRMMVNNFYLYGESKCLEQVVIADSSKLDALFNASWVQRLSLENQQKAKRLSKTLSKTLPAEPTIEFQGETVVVKIIFFGGMDDIIQGSYTISRHFPHKITTVEEKKIFHQT